VRVSDVAPTPLDDLRVVEISDRIAGGYCGKLLVDAGADVVKVEPVTGDPLRRFTATGAVPPSGADSPLFSYLNAGKRSVTTVSGALLAHADIVIFTATRSSALERGSANNSSGKPFCHNAESDRSTGIAVVMQCPRLASLDPECLK
jgi:crotonobetainyl-CoA:carnitine CoA-transferase CaiB-like acyl-CoA transferase